MPLHVSSLAPREGHCPRILPYKAGDITPGACPTWDGVVGGTLTLMAPSPSLQGSLVDYLRSRGRSVLGADCLLKFSL